MLPEEIKATTSKKAKGTCKNTWKKKDIHTQPLPETGPPSLAKESLTPVMEMCVFAPERQECSYVWQ